MNIQCNADAKHRWKKQNYERIYWTSTTSLEASEKHNVSIVLPLRGDLEFKWAQGFKLHGSNK